MGSFKNLPFITTLLVLLLLSLTPTYSSSRSNQTKYTPDDLIKTICTHTPCPATCEATLRSDPKSSTADTKGLTLIMIDVVKSKFINVLKVATDLAAKGSSDIGVIKALAKWIPYVKYVVSDSVPEAVTAVTQNNPKFGEEAMLNARNVADLFLSSFPTGKTPRQLAIQLPACRCVSDCAVSFTKMLE